MRQSHRNGSESFHACNLESQWPIITGYFTQNDGLPWGIVAHYFELLGFPGRPFAGLFALEPVQTRLNTGSLHVLCRYGLVDPAIP